MVVYVCGGMSSDLFENVIYKMCLEIIYFIYMYKKDLALNNLCYKIQIIYI